MTDPAKEFDEEAVVNPSSGIFARNPTRVEITDKAADQDEIVKTIMGARRQRQTMRIAYEDKKAPIALPGMVHIRSMDLKAITRLCESLMRMKPNIFRVLIRLGNYENQRPISNVKTRQLNTTKQRFYTEIGQIMGDILGDRTLNVTELVYTVHNVNPGLFNATGEVFGAVSDEEYSNDELFNPYIEIEYFSNN